MTRATAIAALAALTVLTGCYNAEKQKLLTEEFRTDAVSLPLTVQTITVTDGRSGIDARPLNVHSTGPAHKDSVQPPMSVPRKALIEGELRRYVRGGQPVAVVAKMITGRQTFSGSSMRATESAEVEIEFVFNDPASGRMLFTGTGRSKPEVESSSASQAYSDALFDRAIEISVYAAMRGLQKDVLK